MLLLLVTCFLLIATAVTGCGYPGCPAHATVTFSTEDLQEGTVATYYCDRGFELLGPSRKVCQANGTWIPAEIPFCVHNVAVGKAPMQSSAAQGGYAPKAIDGSTSNVPNPETCTMTEVERAPWWYVNLLEPYMIQLVRIDFGRPCCANNIPATIVVRVGNHRPDVAVNPICSRYVGPIEVGRPLFLPCTPPMAGAFVSIHFEGPPGNPLSICEAFVYTNQAIPLESCPSFRDQPLGGTATFNGKCYTFYNNQPTTFESARRVCESRGGSLIDETSPVLQGFLSWELWQRHRSDPSGQFWMGATRDKTNPNNWKWLSGNDVTLSFWNLPGGNENCSRFDGTKGWLWSDTNCNLNLNFICQHKPLTCGHPEQPGNSTLTVTSRDFTPGTVVKYACSPGDLLIGPEKRVCQPTGYYNEYPPTCKHLECGMPADIPNGGYKFVNETKFYMSMVSYFCNNGFSMVGRGDLTCDVDEKWDGPPPRCESMTCPPATPIMNGYFASSTNITVTGTTVTYFCSDPAATLYGQQTITCLPSGTWSADTPECTTSVRPPPASVGGQRVPGLGSLPTAPPSLPLDPVPEIPPPDTPTSDNSGFLPIPSLLDWFTSPTLPPAPPDLPPSPPPMPPPTLPPLRAPPAHFAPHPPPTMLPNLPLATVIPPNPPPTEPPAEVVHTGPSGPNSFEDTQTSTAAAAQPPSTTTTEPPPTTMAVVTTPSTTTTTTTTTTAAPATHAPSSSPVPPSHPPLFQTAPPTHPARAHHPTVTHVYKRPSTTSTVLYDEGPREGIDANVNVQNVTIEGRSNKDISTAGHPMRLTAGGVLALSLFGGFVVLAAIITIIVIVYRRKRRPRGSMDDITVSTYDSGSGSENGGLTKYYKRAWENLRNDKGLPSHLGHDEKALSHHVSPRHAPAARQETLDNPNYRAGRGAFEGLRDSNEMTVSDSAAWAGGHKPRHQRPHRPRNNNNNNNQRHNSRPNSHDDDQQYRPWYRLHRQ